MVKPISTENKTSLEVNIIPKLKEYNNLTLSEGDTLVMYVNSEKWDINEAQALFNQVEKAFPRNNIFVPFNLLTNSFNISVVPNPTSPR